MSERPGGEDPRLDEEGMEEGAHRRFSPFGELQGMMEDLVDGFRGFTPAAYARYPRMEMVETADFYHIWMDVPGVVRNELNVSALGDELTVSGQRKRPQYPADANVRRSECSYGRFRRVVRLPADVDGEAIRAKLKSGVLRVTLPRRVDTEGRTIDVEADG
jgi:HSP20 family protein